MNVTDCSSEQQAVQLSTTLLIIVVFGVVIGLFFDGRRSRDSSFSTPSKFRIDDESLIPRVDSPDMLPTSEGDLVDIGGGSDDDQD